MHTSFDVEGLLNGLEKNQGPFLVKAVIPDDLDPALFHCHIRSTSFESLYGVEESEQGISVCYDAERKMLALYIRVYMDIPNTGYAWGLEYVNDLNYDDACPVRASIVSEDDTEESEGTLTLECSYHLSLRRLQLPKLTPLMARMVGDAMQLLFTEAYHQVDEMGGAFDEYSETRPN